MLGFRGTEDLGDGLQALFHLESGFEGPKGSSGTNAFTFNRRSIVGLKSAKLGTFTMGRNQPLADALWAIDPTGQQFIGSATLVRGRNWQGYANMLSYETPNWGGFNVQVVTALSEQAGSNKKGRKDMIQLIYAQSNFDVRVIYDLLRDSNGQYSDLWSASKELTWGGTWTIIDAVPDGVHILEKAGHLPHHPVRIAHRAKTQLVTISASQIDTLRPRACAHGEGKALHAACPCRAATRREKWKN